MPYDVELKSSSIVLSRDLHIATSQKQSKYLQSALTRYSKYISELTGISVKIDKSPSSSGNLLTISCKSKNCNDDNYPELNEDESYILNVTETESSLSAITLTGIVRGLSTFVQLIERDKSSGTV
ncbi:unnamed protein product, partial [Adineta ricciae]